MNPFSPAPARRRFVTFVFALLLASLCFAPRLVAQDVGQVSGTVTDPSGAVVPSANVTIRNLSTNATRDTTTNGQGSFQFTGLLPSPYEVSIPASAGFGAALTRVEVTVGGRATVDVRLSANASATVEVTAETGVQVNSQTQELSQVVTETQVSQLPSLTRNPYDFVALSGNISSGDQTSGGGSQNVTTRGVGFNINGQRSTGTEILLDGVENVTVFGDAVGIKVPIDAVHEFRVITSNYEPQYGRASGGVVSVATRSGSNNLHGTVWEFNRLSAYTANTVTNAQSGIPRGHYTRNQFGFAVGGPIVQDKLFFFGSTEWTRVRSSAGQTASVPTPQFLAQAAPSIQQFFSTYAGSNNFNFLGTTTAAQITGATLDANGKNGVVIPTANQNIPVFGKVAYTAPADAGGGLPQIPTILSGVSTTTSATAPRSSSATSTTRSPTRLALSSPRPIPSTTSARPSTIRLIF